MRRFVIKLQGPLTFKCFVIVSSLVCAFQQIKNSDARHLSLSPGETIRGDAVIVEAARDELSKDIGSNKRRGASLERNLKKAHENQNQYYKNLNQDEFLSQITSRKKSNKLHRPKHSGSSFRQHFFGDDLPSSSYGDDEADDDVSGGGGGGDFTDPHFYQQRFIASSNQEDANHKGIKEDDEDSDELLGRYSLVNSYFDNEYSLSMLNSMECITPTKSKGYCSTFRACVPSLFTSDGELQAPALAELVSMSIGYCTTDVSGGGSNVLMKRISNRFTAVSNRIICCPGSPPLPGTTADDTSAEKFNDFLAGKGPQVTSFDEDDKRTPVASSIIRRKKPNSTVSEHSVIWSANEDEFNAHQNVYHGSGEPFASHDEESVEIAGESDPQKLSTQETLTQDNAAASNFNTDKQSVDNVQQIIPIEAFHVPGKVNNDPNFSDQLVTTLNGGNSDASISSKPQKGQPDSFSVINNNNEDSGSGIEDSLSLGSNIEVSSEIQGQIGQASVSDSNIASLESSINLGLSQDNSNNKKQGIPTASQVVDAQSEKITNDDIGTINSDSETYLGNSELSEEGSNSQGTPVGSPVLEGQSNKFSNDDGTKNSNSDTDFGNLKPSQESHKNEEASSQVLEDLSNKLSQHDNMGLSQESNSNSQELSLAGQVLEGQSNKFSNDDYATNTNSGISSGISQLSQESNKNVGTSHTGSQGSEGSSNFSQDDNIGISQESSNKQELSTAGQVHDVQSNKFSNDHGVKDSSDSIPSQEGLINYNQDISPTIQSLQGQSSENSESDTFSNLPHESNKNPGIVTGSLNSQSFGTFQQDESNTNSDNNVDQSQQIINNNYGISTGSQSSGLNDDSVAISNSHTDIPNESNKDQSTALESQSNKFSNDDNTKNSDSSSSGTYLQNSEISQESNKNQEVSSTESLSVENQSDKFSHNDSPINSHNYVDKSQNGLSNHEISSGSQVSEDGNNEDVGIADTMMSNGSPFVASDNIHGENSTFIKISPEPVSGVNGKFTLEKGVHVEKATSETPRPKPNPAYQAQIGETTVNIIKTEATVDSNSLLLINTHGNRKPVGDKEISNNENIDDLQPPTFSAKLPYVNKNKFPIYDHQNLNTQDSLKDKIQYNPPAFEATTFEQQLNQEIQNDTTAGNTNISSDKNKEEEDQDITTRTPTTSGSNVNEQNSFANENKDHFSEQFQINEANSVDGILLNDESLVQLPTTTGQYFDDEGSTYEFPTTTGQYSYENLDMEDHDSGLVPTTTNRNYFNGEALKVPNSSDGITTDSSKQPTTTLRSYSDEGEYSFSDHNKQVHEEGTTTISHADDAQEDESFIYMTTLDANVSLEVPSTPSSLDTKNNSTATVFSTPYPLTDSTAQQAIKELEHNKGQAALDESAFPGNSAENENQLFLGKEPSSYEMQSFDDSAELHSQSNGGNNFKPKPTNNNELLGTGGEKQPSFPAIGTNVPSQTHEDDSLENEHNSPYPASSNGWSIDQLYQQQDKLKPLNSALDQTAETHSNNHLSTGDNSDGIKGTSNEQNAQDQSSDELLNSSKFHQGNKESAETVSSENISSQLGSSESGNELPLSLQPFQPSFSSQSNEKPAAAGQSGSAYKKPQLTANEDALLHQNGVSTKPLDSSDHSIETSLPSSPGSEVGGVNPQATAGRPEYQILSACASQDYYRSIEQESLKQYPYLSTIVGGSRPFCSGSLITDRHVLTAAHFLANITVADVFHMRVHVGYRAGFGGQTEGPFAVRKVLKVIRHKGFSFDKLLNDIAILILDRPIRFSEDVHPVCLSNSPQLYSTGSTDAFETGWVEDPLMKKISPHHPFVDPHILKYFSFGYKNVTWTLQESLNKVKTNEECQANYAFLEKSGITITDSMICSSTEDGKSCSFKGNSGAPLFLANEGKPIQIGLVSWGIGCGHFPQVYTNLFNYLPWIEKVVERTS